MPAKKHNMRPVPDLSGKVSRGAFPEKAMTAVNAAEQGSATPKAALRKNPVAGVMSSADEAGKSS